MDTYNISYLEQLEAESIYLFRETAAEFKNPVMLYSIGKDSSVMLRLAQKAFYPGRIPFPLMHIDTGYKFREMIEFRDYYIKKIGAELIVYKNEEPEAARFGPESAHTDEYIYYKKTKALLDALNQQMATLAPTCAKHRAIPRLMPLPPPVMNTDAPLRRSGANSLLRPLPRGPVTATTECDVGSPGRASNRQCFVP